MSKLASQYREWVRADLARLRDHLATAGAGAEARESAYMEIRRIVHDLRGQGSTFGYPLITRVAASISRTLKERADGADADADISAHVEAITAVVEQDVAADDSDAGARIVETLQAAIGRTVA